MDDATEEEGFAIAVEHTAGEQIAAKTAELHKVSLVFAAPKFERPLRYQLVAHKEISLAVQLAEVCRGG